MTASVVRDPPNGIEVLVCGAGVGGLLTALECWRRGCDVRVLEKAKKNQTHGDSFVIGPSAYVGFRHWPELEKKHEEISYHPLLAYHNTQGERLKGPFDMSEAVHTPTEGGNELRLRLQSRPQLHSILLEQATKVGVKVEYESEIVEYFENEERGRAGVLLKDGSRHEADLVVAADGARGQSWPLISGHPVPARSSGRAMFRAGFPSELATADPVVAERLKLGEDGKSMLELWVGAEVNFMLYRNEKYITWGLDHEDLGGAKEEWGHRVDPEEALKVTATVPGWPEVADRIIKATPAGSLVDWRLMWRDPQPKWTSPAGLVVSLGDAAHSFLPSSGNGGTQAIEDAFSLAACLSKAGGKQNIPDATRVHNLLRFERVSCLQAFGVVNRAARDTKKNDVKEKKYETKIGKWIVLHNPEEYAFSNYDAALAHLKDGAPFKNTNTPANLVYTPWTIEGLLDAQKRGEPTILDADWS